MIQESELSSRTRSPIRYTALSGAWAWRRVLTVSVLVLLVTSIPYAAGYINVPPSLRFMGIIYNVHDYGAYRSWVRQAGETLLIRDQLTSEPNEPFIFHPLWILLGQFERRFGLTFESLFQLERWAAGLLLMGLLYHFLRRFQPAEDQRWFTFLVVILGSGLGWVWVALKQLTGRLDYPLDVYLVPGNSFASLMTAPHFVVALSMLLLTFWLALSAFEKQQWRYWFGAGFSALILGLIHYELVTVYAVLALFFGLVGWREYRDRKSVRSILGAIIILATSAPAVLYQLAVYQFNPVWRAALQQYPNLGVWTPNPLHLVILLGPLLLVALGQLVAGPPLSKLDGYRLFVRVWLVVGLVLIYLPLPFQAMLLNGLQVPIAILAAEALFERLVPWLKSRWPASFNFLHNRWVFAILVFVALTNMYWLAWRIADVRRFEHPYYLNTAEVRALEWLDRNASSDDIAISALETGFYLSGLGDVRAFLAHGVYTLDFDRKRQVVERFFNSGVTDVERRQIVQAFGIDYVFFGPSEIS